MTTPRVPRPDEVRRICDLPRGAISWEKFLRSLGVDLREHQADAVRAFALAMKIDAYNAREWELAALANVEPRRRPMNRRAALEFDNAIARVEIATAQIKWLRTFYQRFVEAIGRFELEESNVRETDELRAHDLITERYLRKALIELRRGTCERLKGNLPGRSDIACSVAAGALGHEWRTLLASSDHQTMAAVVNRAIADVRRTLIAQPQRRPGARSAARRIALLAYIADIAGQFPILDEETRARAQRTTLDAAPSSVAHTFLQQRKLEQKGNAEHGRPGERIAEALLIASGIRVAANARHRAATIRQSKRPAKNPG